MAFPYFFKFRTSLTWLALATGWAGAVPPSVAQASPETPPEALSQSDAPALDRGHSEPAVPEVHLLYAQSAGAWGTYQSIQEAKGNLPAIDQILEDHYGTFEDSFTSVGVDTRLRSPWESPIARALYCGVTAEGSATGQVQNPVVPELDVQVVAAGILSLGALGDIVPLGLRSRLGLFGGYGREKRIDAVSTDLIDSLPARNGSVSVLGFEADFVHDEWLSSATLWQTRLFMRQSIYWSSLGPTTLNSDTHNPYLPFRLKLQSMLEHDLGDSGIGDLHAALEGILGAQPLPVDILPRIWDYTHPLPAFPELGALAGIGARFRADWSAHSGLALRAGFYGGYPGGDLEFHSQAIHISLGTWGLENSAAYQTLGQQIYLGRLGIDI